ncbi:MAG: squalene/phytoene synthase family protein [Pseudomonadota bacterium]
MTWQACAALVETGDPDRFLATMTGPVAARQALFPLYALNLELAKAPWIASEPMLAEIRLQWWKDSLDEIFRGEPPRRHEVVEPLAEVIAAAHLSQAELHRMIDARRADAQRQSFTSFAQLDAYLDATAGSLGRLTARSLGASSVDTVIVGSATAAAGLGVMLSAQAAFLDAGIERVPGDGAEIAAAARQALTAIEAAREADLPSDLFPALRYIWRIEPILRQAQDDASRLETLRETSPARRKLGFMWRAWRGVW